jgi:hypothetical protein
LQFPHQVVLFGDELVVVQLRVEEMQVLVDQFLCELYVKLVLKGN